MAARGIEVDENGGGGGGDGGGGGAVALFHSLAIGEETKTTGTAAAATTATAAEQRSPELQSTNSSTAVNVLNTSLGNDDGMQLLTRDEVSSHFDFDDCYIIVHKIIYDVSSFLEKHPGGRNVIMEFAGKD
jgi:cytochrome b involved in lipid metabolism